MGHSTDLTDKQWDMVKPIFETNKGGNFVKHDKRDLVNAVTYLVKTGCQWRLLPNDFPPYGAAWSFYRRAVISGKWEKAMGALVKRTRIDGGRKPTPSYGLIDSQSAKTTSASENRGFDGGKKNKGAQAAYRNRYNGEPARNQSPRSQHTWHEIGNRPCQKGVWEVPYDTKDLWGRRIPEIVWRSCRGAAWIKSWHIKTH